MSANLYTNAAGKVSMAYASDTETPWHGTGQRIAPTDTDEQVVEKCGFGFSLVGEQAGYMTASGQFIKVPGKQIVTRSDTGAPVGIVGDRFKFHQPRQIIGFFLDYARSLGLKLETAGVLGNGARYWAMAATDVEADLNGKGKDIARLYALLATAGDGTMTTIADPKAKRVVCSNTWSIAIQDFKEANSKGKTRGNRQSHRSTFSNDKAAEGLGFDLANSTSAFMIQSEQIRSMNDVKVTEEQAKQWFRDLLRPKAERELEARGELNATNFNELIAGPAALRAHKAEISREVRGLGALLEAYSDAPGARPGTVRGLWEASTYFIDHVRGTSEEGRIQSSLFGQGNDIKEQAWTNALALVN